MAVKLVTFLGRPLFQRDADGKLTNRYATTQYEFEEGTVSEATSFFGVTIYHHLRGLGQCPSEVIVLGTSGSHWDALHELSPREDDDHLWANLQLGEAAKEDRVDRNMLDQVENVLSKTLDGISVTCVLIEDARDRASQLMLLECLSERLRNKDKLHLDITHGYRHLGVVALESALFLQQARGVEIENIYYGMFTPGQKVHPAVSLDSVGLLARWAEALAIFERTGRLDRLPDLFKEETLELGEALGELRYVLTTNQIARWSCAVRDVLEALGSYTPIGGPADFVVPDLLRMFERLFPGQHVADWQLRLARHALEANDLIRGLGLLHEAIFSAAIRDPTRRMNAKYREGVARQFDPEIHLPARGGLRDYWLMRNLRNTVTHGSSPKKRVAKLLATEETCANFLGEAIKCVAHWIKKLKEDPPF